MLQIIQKHQKDKNSELKTIQESLKKDKQPQQSFQRELWNRFDLLKLHSSERRKLTEDFAGVIEELSSIEETYSKRIQWVVQQTDKLANVRGNHVCASLFGLIKDHYQKVMSESNNQSIQLKKQIATRLKTMTQYQSQEAKILITQGKQMQQDLKDKSTEIEKAREKYFKTFKEYEEISILQEMMNNLNHIAQEKKTKHQAKQQIVRKQKQEYEQKYKSTIQDYNEFLDTFYDNQAVILQKFELQEDQRCAEIHTSIFELLTYSQSIYKKNNASIEIVIKKTKKLDFNIGTQEFINQNKVVTPLYQKLQFFPITTFNTYALERYTEKIYLENQLAEIENSNENQKDKEQGNEQNGDKNQNSEENNSQNGKEAENNSSSNSNKQQNQMNKYQQMQQMEKDKNSFYSSIFFEIIKNEKLPENIPEDLHKVYEQNIQLYKNLQIMKQKNKENLQTEEFQNSQLQQQQKVEETMSDNNKKQEEEKEVEEEEKIAENIKESKSQDKNLEISDSYEIIKEKSTEEQQYKQQQQEKSIIQNIEQSTYLNNPDNNNNNIDNQNIEEKTEEKEQINDDQFSSNNKIKQSPYLYNLDSKKWNLSDESKCIQIAAVVLDAYKGHQFTGDELFQFECLLDSDHLYRYLLIQCFAQFRIQGKKIFTSESYNSFVKILNIVLNNCKKCYDSKMLNKMTVLSLSYHKEIPAEQKNKSKLKDSKLIKSSSENNSSSIQKKPENQPEKSKQFIQEDLALHDVWKMREFWETSVFESIIEQLDLQKPYTSQTQESVNQASTREKSILFAQLSFQVENMSLFQVPVTHIKYIIEKQLKFFDLPKEQISIINERIKEYEDLLIQNGQIQSKKTKNFFGF